MEERRQIQGWDEIAAYLGVRRRAAQKYEAEHGLPVHRLPGERGRVFGYADELDSWRAGRQSGAEDGRPPEPDKDEISRPPTLTKQPRRFGIRYALGGLGGLLALLIAFLSLGSRLWQHSEPTAIKVEGRSLVALDSFNQPLWWHVLPGMPQEPFSWGQPQRVFADIDGDGRAELLYPFRNLDHQDEPDTLFCFSSTGRLLWKRQIGRELRMAASNIVYPAHYNFVWVGALLKATPKGGVVIVGGRRGGTMLFSVELLDKDGNLVSDYYHLGWLWGMATMDLTGDGYDEVILGGVNDVYGSMPGFGYSMTMLILDSKEFFGQGPSPEDGRRLVGLKTGSEKAVLFLPDFYKAPPERPEQFCLINAIQPLTDGHFKVRAIFNNGTQEIYTEYQFDRNLSLEMVHPSALVRQLLDSRLNSPVAPTAREDNYRKALGNIRVLKDQFKAAKQ